MDKQDSLRFAFGANWARFLSALDQDCIHESERSLREMLGVETLNGKRFLDVGSGSGLSSLVARRLGAKVYSFDYDSQSVDCTAELRRRYFPEDVSTLDWQVEAGSALDAEYLKTLGNFDVVYSWGVLHHTGAMWLGIKNILECVEEGGLLFVALYNDQGVKSHIWWLVKYLYNKLPRPLNGIYAYTIGLLAQILNIVKYTLKLKPMKAIQPLLDYKKNRGMSILHDLIDWIGGFPYEFVRYDLLEEYMHSYGFVLVRGKEATSLGCHEMVFKKVVK